MNLNAKDVIRLLDLQPHPEGGYFRETFCDQRRLDGGRAASTAIYFLLECGKRSHWHRSDAVEGWQWYAGRPLELEIAYDDRPIERVPLGGDLAAGERPQAIVPAYTWQSARSVGQWTLCPGAGRRPQAIAPAHNRQSAQSIGGWTLVGRTLTPGFDSKGFQLASPGWRPNFGERSVLIRGLITRSRQDIPPWVWVRSSE